MMLGVCLYDADRLICDWFVGDSMSRLCRITC